MAEKEVVEISLSSIREPGIAIRTGMVIEELESLAESIREIGVIQPIRVVKDGERYEIEAGHRRFLACRMAGKASVPCIVKGEGGADGDVVKFHENYFREDLNPVEEGKWFVRLQKGKKWSVRDVGRFCCRSENYVSARIGLVTGDARILAALEGGQIGFSQGVEILKAENEGVRRELLRITIENGATISSLRLMRFDFERALRARRGESEPPRVEGRSYETVRCLIECPACEGKYEVNKIYPVSVCKTCYDGLLAGFQEARRRSGGG